MNAHYKRGALEFAAWSMFALNTPMEATPVDGSFRTRIKHLFALDRDDSMVFPGTGGADSAFYSIEPDGTGKDAEYTYLDAVCLVLALDLLELGFPQREAIFLLRYIRDDLAAEIRLFEANERKRVQAGLKSGYDLGPAYDAMPPLYLFVSRRDIRESYEAFDKQAGKDHPLIYGPHFIRSEEDLKKKLVDRMADYRKVALLDLGRILTELPAALERAPKTRRGRQ